MILCSGGEMYLDNLKNRLLCAACVAERDSYLRTAAALTTLAIELVICKAPPTQENLGYL